MEGYIIVGLLASVMCSLVVWALAFSPRLSVPMSDWESKEEGVE